MKTDLISILQDTLSILKNGYYEKSNQKINLKLTHSQMKKVRVFLPHQIETLNYDPHQKDDPIIYQCINIDAFTQARYRLIENPTQKVLVLNLANPYHPGGGVRHGAKAQEEDLCRKSSLLLSLESKEARTYYQYNKKIHSNMGSDALIITPQVEIIKDENNNTLDDTIIVSVMTCAAPVLSYGKEDLTDEQYQKIVKRRIMGMLKVAACLHYENLVLGAFGCGAFGNDAHIVSKLFYEAFQDFQCGGKKTKDLFHHIDFAILDHSPSQYNYKEFAYYWNSSIS